MPDLPWNKCEYFLDEEDKTIWLRGSWSRSMALHHTDRMDVPGYKICLVAPTTIEKLKDDPEYINELKQIIKEKNDAKSKEERPSDRGGND